MYVIPKDTYSIRGKYNVRVNLNISQVCKVYKTPACKPGEYALFVKSDEDKRKFSIFCGYLDFDSVCNYFEMIKYNSNK